MTTYHFEETQGADDAPLIFTFHGTGGDEQQFHGIAEALIPGSHVISPRGDVLENGARRYFKRQGCALYDMEDLDQRIAAMTQFVTEAKVRLKPKRVIAIGYSNGANLITTMAMRQPDLFDDLALLHPMIPWDPAPQPDLAGTRVMIAAGERDPICPEANTRDLMAWFKAQDCEVYDLWHRGGHEITQAEFAALRTFLQGCPGCN